MFHQHLLHALVFLTCVVIYGFCYYPASETLKLGDVTLRMPKNMPKDKDVSELFGSAKGILRRNKQKIENLRCYLKDHPHPNKVEKMRYRKKIDDLKRKMKRDISTFRSKLVNTRNRNPADTYGMMDHLLAFYNDFLNLPSKINECILGRLYPGQKPQKPKEHSSTPPTPTEPGSEEKEDKEVSTDGEINEYED